MRMGFNTQYNKQIILLIMFILLIIIAPYGLVAQEEAESTSTKTSQLVGMEFGIGRDNSLNYLGKENKDLGNSVGFVNSKNTGISQETIDSVKNMGYDQLNAEMNAIQLQESRQEVLELLQEQLNQKDKEILKNMENLQPYVGKNFEAVKGFEVGREKGRIKIADANTLLANEGDMIIEKPSEVNGLGESWERFAKIPKGFEIEKNEDSFVVANKDAERTEELEVGYSKIKLEKDSKITLTESEKKKVIQLEGVGDIEVRGKELKGIKDATIRLGSKKSEEGRDIEDVLIGAEFESENGGEYNLKDDLAQENEQELKIKAEKGGKINFDLEKNELSLEKAQVLLEGETYSSSEKLTVHYDRKKNNNLEGEENAVSLMQDEDGNKVLLKGKVNMEDGTTYNGLDKDALTELREEDKFFDVKGDAIIHNDKHLVRIVDGKVSLKRSNLISEENAETFSFKTERDGKKIIGTLNENTNQLQIITTDGKNAKTALVPLSIYEGGINNAEEVQARYIQGAENTLTKLKTMDVDQEEIDGLELSIAMAKNRQAENFGEDVDITIDNFRNHMDNIKTPELKSNAQMIMGELLQEKAVTEGIPTEIDLINKHPNYDAIEQGNAPKLISYEIAGGKVKGVYLGRNKKYYPITLSPEAYPGGPSEYDSSEISLIRELQKDNSVKNFQELAGEGFSVVDRGINTNSPRYERVTGIFEESRDLYNSVKEYGLSTGDSKLAGYAELSRIQTFQDAKDYDSAINGYLDVAKNNPSQLIRSEAHRYMSGLEMERGNFMKVAQELGLAVQADPTNIQALDAEKRFLLGNFKAIDKGLGGEIDSLFQETYESIGLGEYKSWSETPGKWAGQLWSNSGNIIFNTAGGRIGELPLELDRKVDSIQLQKEGVKGMTALVLSGERPQNFLGSEWYEREDMMRNAMGQDHVISWKELAEKGINPQDIRTMSGREEVIKKYFGESAARMDSEYYKKVQSHAYSADYFLRENPDGALLAASGDPKLADDIFRKRRYYEDEVDFTKGLYASSGKRYSQSIETGLVASELNVKNLVLFGGSGAIVRGVGTGLKATGNLIAGANAGMKARVGHYLAMNRLEQLNGKLLQSAKVMGGKMDMAIIKASGGNSASRFMMQEMAESGAGFGVSRAAGPEWGLVAESLSSHGKFFDAGERIAKQSTKKFAGSKSFLFNDVGDTAEVWSLRTRQEASEAIEHYKENGVYDKYLGNGFFETSNGKVKQRVVITTEGDIPLISNGRYGGTKYQYRQAVDEVITTQSKELARQQMLHGGFVEDMEMPKGNWITDPKGNPTFLTAEARQTPLGFENQKMWQSYNNAMKPKLQKAQTEFERLGVQGDVQIGIQGSSATGVSSKTGRFTTKPGDFDFVIINDDVFELTMKRAEDLARQGKLGKGIPVSEQLEYVQEFRERGVALLHDSRLLPELPKNMFNMPQMQSGIKISQMVARTNSEVAAKHAIFLK